MVEEIVIRKHQDMCQFYITLYELEFDFDFMWSRNWKLFNSFYFLHKMSRTIQSWVAIIPSVEGRTLSSTNELCRVSVTEKVKIVTQFISRYAWESSSRLFRDPMRSKVTKKNVQLPHLASWTRQANCFQWIFEQTTQQLLTFIRRTESPLTSAVSCSRSRHDEENAATIDHRIEANYLRRNCYFSVDYRR